MQLTLPNRSIYGLVLQNSDDLLHWSVDNTSGTGTGDGRETIIIDPSNHMMFFRYARPAQ